MTDSELAHELNLLVLRTRMTFRQTIQRILKSNNVDMTFEISRRKDGLYGRKIATTAVIN